jgi:uncharacterized protein with ACT and thioredoxin-like domain
MITHAILATVRDQPGMLSRLTRALADHDANITHVDIHGAETNSDIYFEFLLAEGRIQALLTALRALAGVERVIEPPTMGRIYGKRIIVMGGGAQVGFVAMGAISEADRHNIRGERISIDTIPLVGERELAAAVRAVVRLPRVKLLVLAGSLMGGEITDAVEEVRRAGPLRHLAEHGGQRARCRRPGGQRSGPGRRHGGDGGRRYREVRPDAAAQAAGMEPYAACYGGHQFGNWAGQLGDGRAITLGEVVNERGERWELQLKGAGPTPYSRTADGRAVLRSSIREFLCSEAMHHLGVPTTRALSVVTTGDAVVRDMFYDGNAEEEPGAIVCRVAPSFIRFGNFEIFAARNDLAMLEQLVDFTIARDFAHLMVMPDVSARRAAWYAEVCERTARLMVHWMRVGFVHGVMNTDNMSILGLTIDYGPYGWIDDFNPNWTPNTTDAAIAATASATAACRSRSGTWPGSPTRSCRSWARSSPCRRPSTITSGCGGPSRPSSTG